MSDELAEAFLGLEPRTFVTVRGFPEPGEETRWHVNNHFAVEGGGTVRHGVVLQREDASAEWLGAVIETGGDGGPRWTGFDHFEGDMSGLDVDEDGALGIDPAGIEVVSVDER